MRRLLALILLMAVFLGGYYLGHQPNSPDIFGQARRLYDRLTTITNDVAVLVGEEENTPEAQAALRSIWKEVKVSRGDVSPPFGPAPETALSQGRSNRRY